MLNHLSLPYKFCKLSHETDLFNLFIKIKLQSNIVFLKVTALGSHTVLETVLPLPITMVKLWYWNSLELVGYNRLNVFQCPKMSFLEIILQFRENKKVGRTQVGRIDWRATGMFTDQKIVYWNRCDIAHYSDVTPSCSWCLVPYAWPFFRTFSGGPYSEYKLVIWTHEIPDFVDIFSGSWKGLPLRSSPSIDCLHFENS